MKKLLTLALATGFIFAFSSCKKEYTCECSTTTDGVLVAGSTVTSTAEFSKKSDAEAWCNTETTVGTTTTKCELQ